MVLIVDTVAGVVVVFCSHFYARSLSHSVHIFCAKSTSYLFSHYFTQNVRYYDALLFGPLLSLLQFIYKDFTKKITG